MDVLILGGTRFVGWHIVEALLGAGHDVSLFHRGVSPADGFSRSVTSYRGDRDGDLRSLESAVAAGRRWDVVVDVSGYVPRVVDASSQLLADAAGRCVFISTISVYAPGVGSEGVASDETAPVIELDDPTVEEITGKTYGGLKVLCERAVERAFGVRCCTIRPGLIIGPRDTTDRFLYWVRRGEGDGGVLAPADADGGGDLPVQLIDGRDLADFVRVACEGSFEGDWNAVGPERRLSFDAMLRSCGCADVTWVSSSWLEEQGLNAGTLPLWFGTSAASVGFMSIDAARARGAGLSWRPLETSIADMRVWDGERGRPAFEDRLTPEREGELLDAWRSSR